MNEKQFKKMRRDSVAQIFKNPPNKFNIIENRIDGK